MNAAPQRGEALFINGGGKEGKDEFLKLDVKFTSELDAAPSYVELAGRAPVQMKSTICYP